ncbi:amino acid/polyamine/organocation transporter (APC superfamily) [Rathayibacter sp. PhB93]|uniref:APC family permease n=1 Tax=unclassified Rathayibacter TaxID=2609250 RepID=UPI000F48603C|nr:MULTISPECIES: APC family permease [unclassified Rathayibacter]ROQ15657.1 amino acid/polyamine/organocation transporter (APC superfamily) [Rathayibacter sp. PhB93]TDQ15596.1 amino acid/polyamine/organocation transporter (APC superfamily) [Rathayibacter sp. PhB1]
MTADASLARRLGFRDAVVIGLGSMIGAGLFSAFGPAAAAAGPWLLVGLALAAIVAWANASSTAQLAAQYPRSGGAYLYGRERLGEWPGFLAGWSFVVGKTASCAAMALTVAAYAAPAGWERPVAVAAVVTLVAVNVLGVTRTALATRILLSIVVVVLVVAMAAAAASGPASVTGADRPFDAYGVLQSAGMLFFAFAGYARLATMGEEVRDPARTIPRAILGALVLAVLLYTVVGAGLLAALGPERLAASTQPLVDAAAAWPWTAVPIRVGAAAASLGALLALIAGIGRTSLAMARNGDLPRALAVIDPVRSVPRRAEIAVGLIVVVLVLVADLRSAIGFSSFGVLLYYLIANIAALTQEAPHRRYPRPLAVVGVAGCLLLVATLPPASIAGGLAVLAVGAAYRILAQSRVRRSSQTK